MISTNVYIISPERNHQQRHGGFHNWSYPYSHIIHFRLEFSKNKPSSDLGGFPHGNPHIRFLKVRPPGYFWTWDSNARPRPQTGDAEAVEKMSPESNGRGPVGLPGPCHRRPREFLGYDRLDELQSLVGTLCYNDMYTYATIYLAIFEYIYIYTNIYYMYIFITYKFGNISIKGLDTCER